MILLTGGEFQGKLACAQELWRKSHGEDREPVILEGRDLEPGHLPEDGADIFSHLTIWYRRCLEAGVDPEVLLSKFLEQNPEMILVTRELGCGLVPIDAFDRRYREEHGRCCCRLVARAASVYRVSCGLAVRIK